jgi:hypothetical protein
LQIRQYAIYCAQEGAGIDVIKVFAMPKILLFQARQRAILIDGVEEIEHRCRNGLIVIPLCEPGHWLFVSDIKCHGDFRMNALEKANRYRIGNGVVQLLVFHLLKQFSRAKFRVNRPAECRVFLLFKPT